MLLGPFYLFKSGNPQIDDYLIGVLILLTLIGYGLRLHRSVRPVVQSFAWFVFYVTAVNATWALLLGRLPVLFISVFYIYNFLVFTFFLSLHGIAGKRLLSVTMHALAVSLLLQCILSIVFPGSGSRATLFFNNPNQLAYYAVAAGTVFFVGSVLFRPARGYQVIVLGAVVYLTAISLSKAGLAAAIALGGIVFIRRPAVPLAFAVLLLGLNLTTDLGNEVLDKLAMRFADSDQSDSLAGRGYDRIVNHPEYLVFGAGEGEPERFETLLEGHEMHSSFGTIVFSYGAIGTGLLLLMFAMLYRRAGSSLLVYTVPLFLYGLTHQGFRLTLFWALLAYALCVRIEASRRTGGGLDQRPPGPPFVGRRSFDRSAA